VDERAAPQETRETTGLEPLFTLVSGEGDGFLLGMAAGDTAGGAWELGYSAVTQQATVIAYEMIQDRTFEPNRIRTALRELDGSQDEDPVYRVETPAFRAWLNGAAAGSPVVWDEPSLDGVARGPVLGVVQRRDPEALVEAAISIGRMFDSHASSLMVTVISATATAASCFAQSGRDLIAGVGEAVMPAVSRLGSGVVGHESLDGLGDRFGRMVSKVGVTTADEAVEAVGGDPSDPLNMVLSALLLTAPASERFHVAVEQSARIGGSALGAFAGSVIGARIGIKGWPWAFANDTWFAEIGRRLVRGPDQVEDLPIPYAVEHHLKYGPRPGFR
jgi:hypothetical protein